MSYGSPRSEDEIEAYYTHIRRGRPPTDAEIEDLRRRYDAIGGLSPLRARTEAQADAIGRALAESEASFEVRTGNKHAEPFIEDTVALFAPEVDNIVGVVLAPHYSRASVGQYHERAAAACAERDLPYFGIDSWHTEPAYIQFLAGEVSRLRDSLDGPNKVLFTAHSLPERAVANGDPYELQLQETAEAVSAALGLSRFADWGVCFQSAPPGAEGWLGPDVYEMITALAETGRSKSVIVCAEGFVSDHLEILWDLDVQARQVATGVGLQFARTAMINDDPAVMGALAERVVEARATLLQAEP